jgi:hypothetical protein
MNETQNLFEDLYKVKLHDVSLQKAINNLVPITSDMTQRQEDNAKVIRRDILFRYNEAPDLKDREKTGARFIQAVADSTSHIVPMRMTKNYAENKFKRTLDGNDVLDRAVDIMLNVA